LKEIKITYKTLVQDQIYRAIKSMATLKTGLSYQLPPHISLGSKDVGYLLVTQLMEKPSENS